MPSPVFIVTLAVLCTLVAPIIGIPLSVGPFQGCAVRRVSARSSVLSIDFSLAVQPVEMGHLVGSYSFLPLNIFILLFRLALGVEERN
jgi:hypothetical protein